MAPRAVLDVLGLLWTALEPLQQPMAIVEGLALAAWNHPRSTQDVDVLLFTDFDEQRLGDILRHAGFLPRSSDAQSKALGSLRISQWTIEPLDAVVEVEVDVLLGSSDFYRNVLERSVEFPIETSFDSSDEVQKYRFASCEDLILMKLVAGRLIDLADIETLISRNPGLDFNYIEHWVGELGVEGEWKRMRGT